MLAFSADVVSQMFVGHQDLILFDIGEDKLLSGQLKAPRTQQSDSQPC